MAALLKENQRKIFISKYWKFKIWLLEVKKSSKGAGRQNWGYLPEYREKYSVWIKIASLQKYIQKI